MTIRFFLLFTLALITINVFAAKPNELPKNASAETRWVFDRANACLNGDKIHRIAANGECLAIQTYFGGHLPKSNPVLLVFIHGDGIPGGGPSDYLKYQATKFVRPDVVPVVLIRPGYYDSYGHYSTGESHAFSCDGYPCDSYRPHTVDTLAAAVRNLKQFYQPRCTILVGHSGGSIMSSIILGRFPNLANGAVLASTTNNVQQWATKHGWGSYANSLSPDQFVSKIPQKDFVYIVSGKEDTDTYPPMAKAYYNSLIKHGVNAKFISVPGGIHNSIVLTNVKSFDQAITDAIKHCSQ